MTGFTIRRYSALELGAIFKKFSHNSDGNVESKSHVGYFNEYFEHVGAKTILIEEPYTDKDYIEDYAAYYARCHTDYKKTCVRLHFFNHEFDEPMISRCLAREEAAITTLKQSYLGFIIVKPLPLTIIGRTCLKSYNDNDRIRHFPAAHEYKVHLLGMEFIVHSVPFQEQDTDVAACATSALWSALNSTGRLFHHRIPTPAAITESAAVHQRPSGRTLPAANGLSPEQMADAIRSTGLEPLMLKVIDRQLLKVAVYAYLRASIPSIIIGVIGHGPIGKAKIYGKHAVAVTGFGEGVEAPKPIGPAGCLFRATTMPRLYVHDDQVGPFARLRYENDPTGTSWVNSETRQRGDVFLLEELLIVPLYHKIRVPVDSVLTTIQSIDKWLESEGRQNGLLPIKERIVWDLYLHNINDFKSDIFGDTALNPPDRKAMLEADLPKYIWRAEAHADGKKLFELLFDATDLLQGAYFLNALPYDDEACTAIGVIVANPAMKQYIREVSPHSAINAARWFEKYAVPQQSVDKTSKENNPTKAAELQ